MSKTMLMPADMPLFLVKICRGFQWSFLFLFVFPMLVYVGSFAFAGFGLLDLLREVLLLALVPSLFIGGFSGIMVLLLVYYRKPAVILCMKSAILLQILFVITAFVWSVFFNYFGSLAEAVCTFVFVFVFVSMSRFAYRRLGDDDVLEYFGKKKRAE